MHASIGGHSIVQCSVSTPFAALVFVIVVIGYVLLDFADEGPLYRLAESAAGGHHCAVGPSNDDFRSHQQSVLSLFYWVARIAGILSGRR